MGADFTYLTLLLASRIDAKMLSLDEAGVWFLPEAPNKRVAGTLRFDQESGATLDLVGSLKDVVSFGQSFEPLIVLGITTKGKPITLYRCYETASNLSFATSTGTFITSRVTGMFVFVGAHFQTEDALLFDALNARLTLLEQWVTLSGFTIEFDESGRTAISYVPVESIGALDADDVRVTLGFSNTVPGMEMVQTKASIEQRAFFRIEAKQDRSLERYLETLQLISTFLAIATDGTVQPISLDVFSRANEEVLEPGRKYKPPIQLFYRLPNPVSPDLRVLPVEMLFTYPQLMGELPRFLGNWVSKARLLEPIYDLYFGTLYNASMFLDQRFLALAKRWSRTTAVATVVPRTRHTEGA